MIGAKTGAAQPPDAKVASRRMNTAGIH